MKSLEQEFRRRFRNQEQQVEQSEAEALWESIAADLGEESKSRRKVWLIYFLLFGLLYFGTVFYLLSNEDETEVSSVVAVASEGPSDCKEANQGLPTKSSKSAIGSSTTTPLFSNTNSSSNLKKAKKDSKHLTTPKIIEPVQVNPPIEINRPVSQVTTNLPRLTFFIEDQVIALSPKFSQPDPEAADQLSWKIGLLLGANQIFIQHQSENRNEILEQKENATSSLWGTSFGLNFGAVFKQHWLFGTGLEYHQQWTRFEMEQQSMEQVLKENQLLTVWLDAVSGDALNQRFGDTLVNATRIRTVVHHNEFRQISIPIELGWQGHSKRLTYGFTLGPVLQFTSFQEGKTLGLEGAIVEFNQEDDSAPLRSFGLGMRFAPFIGLQLSDHLSLNLNPHWTMQQGASVEQLDVQRRVHQFSLALGVGYSF